MTVTKGHSASQGGLRGHSIGEIYPLSLVSVGFGSNEHWEIMHCLDSNFECPKFRTSQIAYSWATSYKFYILDRGDKE